MRGRDSRGLVLFTRNECRGFGVVWWRRPGVAIAVIVSRGMWLDAVVDARLRQPATIRLVGPGRLGWFRRETTCRQEDECGLGVAAECGSAFVGVEQVELQLRGGKCLSFVEVFENSTELLAQPKIGVRVRCPPW
jgi:hypothetical protein